jgi:hypothetical protein
LYDSVYPASNATISIYKPDSGSLFEGSSNKKGQMIMKLPVGSYRYEINWFDYGGAWWRGAGSFLIKKDAAAKVRVELGQMSSSGAACGSCSESSIINA